MSLLPPTSTFAEQVEALFVVLRGRGLALGPLDVPILAEWSDAGAPLEVVARGLFRAAERVRWNGVPGANPRSLQACRPEVEEEIAAWRDRRLGSHEASPMRPADSARSVARALRTLSFPERLSILRTARQAVVHDAAPTSGAWRRALLGAWLRRDRARWKP
jgi:hypothetical protein